MTKRGIWITGVLSLTAVAAGVFFWSKRAPATVWRTAKVERGSVQVLVTASGTLQAVVTIQVGTQVSGTISALYADFNSHVKQGQVIARLDTTLLRAALSDANSNLSKAAAQASQAAAEHRRSRALFDRSLVSQAELDQAEAADRVANANLSSARAQVDRARINLRYATIVSPIEGTVLSRAVDVGQTVAASFNTPTLFTIAGDLRKMRVQASVDEADIGKVREGQKVTFNVDAFPDTIFDGVVEQIRLEPVTVQNVVTYNVIIAAPNPELKLMPGMTANLTVTVTRSEGVLLVPTAALRFRPPQKNGADSAKTQSAAGGWKRNSDGVRGNDRARIFLLENDTLKPVRVRVGLSDGSKTEIAGTVEEGATVVTGTETSKQAGSASASPFGMPRGTGGGGAGRRP